MIAENAVQGGALTNKDSAIVAEVTEHYDYWVARAPFLGESREDAERTRALAIAMLTACLSLPPGERFSPLQWMSASEWVHDTRKLGSVLPYFIGASRVLDMHFEHPELGVLTQDVVWAVMQADPMPVSHNGVSLATSNVLVVFSRPRKDADA